MFTCCEIRRPARRAPLFIAALALLSVPLLAQDVSKARIDEKVRDLNGRLKREGAKWRAGNVSAFYPTEDESRKLFPPIPPIPQELRETLPVIRATGAETFPLAWDWREMNGVTSVKHQFRPHDCDTCYRYCGSCYAFAACAQLESFIKIYDGREEDLSEQQILSCHSEPTPPAGPGGCYGGDATLAYNSFLDPGAVAETCMVYEAADTVPCGEHECSIHGRISGWSIVEADVNSLKLALQSGPVWINMYSCDDFKYFYHGGSYTYPPGLRNPPNHAMLLVGWNDTLTVRDSTGCETIGSWIVKNSWGAAWGYEGYAYIQYGTPTFAVDAAQIHYTRSPVTRLYLREPDGGQVWAAGSRHKILWRNAGIAADHFEVGCFAGEQYLLIDGDVDPGASELTWAIPSQAAGAYRVRIAAHGAGDELLGSDESDASFTILEPRTEWDASGVGACGSDADQETPLVVCDNTGGAIVVWEDSRSGNHDIFAQRLDGSGRRLWPPSGTMVCATSSDQSGFQAVSNGSGGAFVVWENPSVSEEADSTSIDIRGQSLRSDGTPLTQDVSICSARGAQRRPQLARDNGGGAFVVWEDMRNGNWDIYAERMDPGGGDIWEWDGIPVSTASDAQTRPQIAEDGRGGAIIAWIDRRSGSEHIYAQRLDPAGAAAWGHDGVAVCRAPGIVGPFKIVTDLDGGAIVAWLGRSGGETPEIRAQRISSDGSVPWPEDGVAVCPAAKEPKNIDVAPDGLGGAFVVWDDGRGEWVGQVYHPVGGIRTAERQRDIYAERIGAEGTIAWAADGVPIASLARTQELPHVTYDGTGGAIVVWSDKRDSRWLDAGDENIPEDEDNYDVFGQRIDRSGAIMWHENGEPLCADVSRQSNTALTADHGAAVFVAWEDSRASGSRIFMQKIDGRYSAHRSSVTASIRRNGASYPASSTYLSVCPHGDRLDTLAIVCDFKDEDMVDAPVVRPSEIELLTDGMGFSFCDSSDAGTPGTPENGYVVTLLRCHVKGCGACAEPGCSNGAEASRKMMLRYSGAAIGHIQGLIVRSIDARGDGVVNAIENDEMGTTFMRRSPESTFRRCYDYDADGRVASTDLSLLGAHYGHGSAAGPAAAARLPAPTAASAVSLRLVIKRPAPGENAGKLLVTVFLENARNLSSLCFGLNNEIPSLAFRGWTSVPRPGAAFPIVSVTRDEHAILFIAGYDLRTIEGPLVEVGTLEYDVTGSDSSGGGAAAGEDDLFLVFGDFVDVNGAIGRIAGATCEEDTRSCRNRLWNCYPNPFNPKTTIRYSIEERGPVALRIYTVAGQLVRTLVNDTQSPSVSGYSIQWDGRNNTGLFVASGVYFYRLTAGDFSETKKMVLLK